MNQVREGIVGFIPAIPFDDNTEQWSFKFLIKYERRVRYIWQKT